MLEILKSLFQNRNTNLNLDIVSKCLRDRVEISVFFKGKQVEIEKLKIEKFGYILESDFINIDDRKKTIYLDYNDIYLLDYDELEYFKLPKIFKGIMKIENDANFLNTTYGVKFRIKFFEEMDKEYYSKYENNYLTSNYGSYFMTKSQNEVFKYINLYNNSEKIFEADEQYRIVEKIKKEANKTNIIFNDEIDKIEEVEVISAMEIDFKDINKNFLQIIPKLVDEEEQSEKLLKEFFKSGVVKKFYEIENNGRTKKIVFSKELKNVLQVIKEEKGFISKEDFLNQKGKIFNDPRMETENIEIIYGPRVKGLGYLTYRASPFKIISNVSWFEKELPSIDTFDRKIILLPEDLEKLELKKLEAQSTNKKVEVIFKDENEKIKILMDSNEINNEIEKLKNSIRDYTEFKNKNDLLKILEKKLELEAPYVIYNGFYVNVKDSNKKIEEYISNLEEEENEEKEFSEKESNSQMGLILKDNIETIEHSENSNEKEIKIKKFERPLSLKKEINLFEFQEESIAHFQNLYLEQKNNGIIISDDMGLGKTIQILTFLAWLKEKNEVTPSLVVVPSSLIYNWYNESEDKKIRGEIQKFFEPNTFKVSVIKGKMSAKELENIKEADIVLTTYETLRINHVETGKIKWKVIVCDEAQKIKNPNTLGTTAVKAQNAFFKIACTATPIENSLVDLWCIADFAKPGLLLSLHKFKENYIKKIEKDKLDLLQMKELNEQLKEILGKYYIRRTKEVLNKEKKFPKKIIEYYPVKLSDEQNKILNGYYDMKNLGYKTISLIQGLIMTCSHPRLPIKNENLNINSSVFLEEAAKLEETKNILDSIKIKNEKILIFTKYKRMQIIFSNIIEHYYKFRPIIINGEIESFRRKELLDEFKSKKGFNIIILSPEAAGIGLNIVEANHVIHYTRHWNPAKEDQATDRAYRIGQEKNVYVYYPIVYSEKENKEKKTFESYKEMNNYTKNWSGKSSPEENLNKIVAKKRIMLEDFFLAAVPETEDNDLKIFFDENLLTKENEQDIERKIRITDNMNQEQFEIFITALLEKKYNGRGYLLGDTETSLLSGIILNKESILFKTLHLREKIEEKAILDMELCKKELLKNSKNHKLIFITNMDVVPEFIVEKCNKLQIKIIDRKDLMIYLRENSINSDDIKKVNSKRYSLNEIKEMC